MLDLTICLLVVYDVLCSRNNINLAHRINVCLRIFGEIIFNHFNSSTMKLKFLLLNTFLLIFNSIILSQTPGASFCGPYTASQPISLNGASNMVISDLDISNPNGNAIILSNCSNITIEKCFLHNSTGNGIQLYNCTNITITNNRFETVATGVYAIQSQGIKVTYNDSKNVQGPLPRGQMAQFNEVSGGGNQINFNVSENTLGQSTPEDAINIYRSNGLPNDPIQIYGNWIRGGGPSMAGSGIMAGDNGGSYIVVKDNILVNPGQVGIAIPGGHHNQLINNKVYGASQPFTNVGLYVWNWSGNPAGTVCNNHTVSGNEVHWTNKDGNLSHRWDGGNCGTITGWNNNTWGASIDETILPAKILLDCNVIPPNPSGDPGATFCGPYTSSQPISLNGASNMTISDLDISNPNGNAINLANCDNITIERCFLHNSTGNGVQMFNCTNITITDNRFEKVASGVYAIQSQGIKVTYNDSKNVVGPFPRGSMTQFNEVSGGGNQINFNVSENIAGQSAATDAINVYRSNGLPNDPIQVYGNWIRGGGPFASGSGIMVGDNGGSYIIAKDNILVNPGQVGIAISGGQYNQLIDNKVYGISQPFTNVGLFVWNWSGNPAGTICSDHTVSGNEVYWINKDGNLNHSWNGGGNCGPITGWSNNTWGAPIDETILPSQILVDCNNIGNQYAQLEIYLWLEGTYNTTTNKMQSALLQKNLLPNLQPYGVAPWSYNGTEGQGWDSSDYPTNAIDWVKVSFRTATTAASETLSTAAVLLDDGTLFFPNKDLIETSDTNPYYIVIEHRNHIGAMSATPVEVINDKLRYDFRAADSYSGSSGAGQKEIASDVWALFSGDVDQLADLIGYDINGNDYTNWLPQNGLFNSYELGDFNLDGEVSAADKILWSLNNGIFSSIEK